jgi:hypothetical protein
MLMVPGDRILGQAGDERALMGAQLSGGNGFQPGAGKSGRLRRGGDKNSTALRPDAKVTFAAERAVAGIDDIIASVNGELVGLAVVKQRIEEIAALLLVDRARRPGSG